MHVTRAATEKARYLFNAMQMLSRGQLRHEVKKETHPVELGGRQWHRIDLQLTVMNVNIQQSMFAAKFDEFIMSVTLCGINADQMEMLEQVASKIRFKD